MGGDLGETGGGLHKIEERDGPWLLPKNISRKYFRPIDKKCQNPTY